MREEPASGRGEYPYRGRDRHGLAVVVGANGKLTVAGGPERIDAFAGEAVRWKIVNTSGRELVLEMKITKVDGPGPDDPFREPAPHEIPVPKETAAGKKTELRRTVKPPEAFAGKPTKYRYQLQVKGDPKSALDPDLDIWP
jgi:hypothetical protein